MTMEIDTAILDARRQKLAKEKARHEGAIAAIEAELADIEATKRTLVRLYPPFAEAQQKLRETLTRIVSASVEMPLSLGDQTKTDRPNVADMIRIALEDAASRQIHGLTPAQMLIFVQQHWWPEAKTGDIGSAAWRLWKQKRLNKEGKIYSLPSVPVPESEEQEQTADTG